MFDTDPKENSKGVEPSSIPALRQLGADQKLTFEHDPSLNTAPKVEHEQIKIISIEALIPGLENSTAQPQSSADTPSSREKEIVLRFELKSYARGEGGDLEYVADLLKRIKTAEGLSPGATIDSELMEAVASILARSARHRELTIDGLSAVSEMLSDPDLAILIREYGDFFVGGLGHDLLMGLPELERFEGAALLIERFQAGAEVPKLLSKQVEQRGDPIYALIDNIAQLLEHSVLLLERRIDPSINAELLSFDDAGVRGSAAGKLRAISERIKPHLAQRKRNRRALEVFVASALALLIAVVARVMGMDLKLELVLVALTFLVGFRIAAYCPHPKNAG